MASRIRYFSTTDLPPGLLIGILLGIAQSILFALIPAEINTVFVLLIVFIFLLYLLVPFFVNLQIMRRRESVRDAKRIARRIGMICASLVILSTIITYMLSLSGVQVAESGGLLDLRLMFDGFLSLAGIALLNIMGLLLSLLGGWSGRVLGSRWQEEQQRYE